MRVGQRCVQLRLEHLELHRRRQGLELIAEVTQPLIDVEEARYSCHLAIPATHGQGIRNIPHGGGTVQLRRKIVRAISRLNAILDDLDGDPETEPWLGESEASMSVPQWPRGSTDKREVEDDKEEALGWTDNIRQVGLGANTADGDSAAPEMHRRGSLRCTPDDNEDDWRD